MSAKLETQSACVINHKLDEVEKETSADIFILRLCRTRSTGETPTGSIHRERDMANCGGFVFQDGREHFFNISSIYKREHSSTPTDDS